MRNLNKPIWHAAPVRYEEPVLFHRDAAGSLVRGLLLFPAEKILRVVLPDGTEIPLGEMTLSGHEIATRNKRVPSWTEEDLFPDASLKQHKWWSGDGRHIRYDAAGLYASTQVLVDYESRYSWDGPRPEFQNLRFVPHLLGGEPLSIVLLGDSISTGADASSFLNRPPFQPAYGELFARRLNAGNLRLHNLSVGGMTAVWGRTQIERVLECAPALVVFAFGMNDASEKHSVEAFRENLRAMCREVLEGSSAEVLLLSGMRANPRWDLAESGRREAFHAALRGLAGDRVGFCDVYSSWKYVEEKKDFWSLTGNGLNHPNDFGHRLYADCLHAAIIPPDHNHD